MKDQSTTVKDPYKLYADLLQKISRLELEIHSRGELTFDEVMSLLKDYYLCFNQTTFYPTNSTVSYQADTTYTRMATLMSLWASCEDIQLSLEDMCELIVFKEMYASIFYCSGFRGFSHLKTYLAEKTIDGNFVIPQNKLALYFILTHIDDIDPYYFSLAEKMPEEIFTVIMLGWLNCSVVLTKQGELNRNALYQHSKLLTKVNPNLVFMSCIINAWMYCSYSTSPLKRDFKKNINKMISNFHRINKMNIPVVKHGEKRDKPRVLVIHERTGRNHAMFRCYLPFFSSMGKFFELYSMAEQELTDDLSLSVFPKHHVITDVQDLQTIVNAIAKIAPDIIYYPSLGMSHWTIYLANLRLAPMQLMSCGHPDSSFADSIDFMYSGPMMPGVENCASENVLLCKDTRFFATKHSELDKITPADLTKYQDGKVHVAINCSAMKISSAFVEALHIIKQNTGDVVRYHFFPSGDGFFNDCYKSMLLRQFPDDIVYSQMPYTQFLKTVGRCHFSMAPFPFGNTNSSVDALVLGLPVVVLKGYELCSYSDFLIMETFKLDDLLICDSVEDYIKKAMMLIQDKSEYQRYLDRIASANVRQYLDSEQSSDTDFGQFIFQLYNKLNMYKSKKHKKIVWDGEKII
jgi:hypothetical protein